MEVAYKLNRQEPVTEELEILSLSICPGNTRQKIGITFTLSDDRVVSYQLRKKDVKNLQKDTQNTTLYLIHPTASCLNGVLNFKIEDGRYRLKIHHFGILDTLQKVKFGAISYMTRDDYNKIIEALRDKL
jgi:hypothetical protein